MRLGGGAGWNLASGNPAWPEGSLSVLAFLPFVFPERKEERFQSFSLDVECASVAAGRRVSVSPMPLISVWDNDNNAWLVL